MIVVSKDEDTLFWINPEICLSRPGGRAAGIERLSESISGLAGKMWMEFPLLPFQIKKRCWRISNGLFYVLSVIFPQQNYRNKPEEFQPKNLDVCKKKKKKMKISFDIKSWNRNDTLARPSENPQTNSRQKQKKGEGESAIKVSKRKQIRVHVRWTITFVHTQLGEVTARCPADRSP